jgi:hypothetical protein
MKAALFVAGAHASTISASHQASANPIRKVVTMLQNIQKKVAAEAETEEKLFDKYMCYCKTGAGELQASISGSDAKIPEVESAIKEAEATKTQLIADLASHQTDRTEAKSAMAKATAIREKEAKVFAKYKSEADTNIAALNKAVSSLEKGMSGSFLQTSGASLLRNLFQTQATVSDVDRDTVLSFLSGSSEYSPQSGQISGILKQLGDDMTKDLNDTTDTENGSIKSYEDLMAAKTKEVNALTQAIEEKTIRSGEVAVKIVMMKQDLTDTEKELLDDKQFLADMEKNCAHKEAEWAVIKQTRADEAVALSETIKLLNDDDALELFKKTLPSAAASFIQVETQLAQMRARALELIKQAQSKADPTNRHTLDFIALALHGKQAGFEKVIKMIDQMAVTLKKEQEDDDNKKAYCAAQFDATDDKKKGLEQSISDSEAAIADAEETISRLTTELKDTIASIKALDKSIAEATEQRQKENEEFSALMAGNTAAVELLGMAKNRLNKFYNPKLYVAPPKRELSEEERIAVSMGGTMAPTPAPGGISGTGITAFAQDEPAPPPAGPAAFKKKGEETNGVVAMMDLLIKDLDKEMQEAETAEKDAQADYETMAGDAAEKRAADSKAVTEKEAAKASSEEALQQQSDAKADSTKELLGTLEYIQTLHAECDWLVQHFDVRTEARASEVDALQKAKAVLSGADYSLLQTRVRSLRVRK